MLTEQRRATIAGGIACSYQHGMGWGWTWPAWIKTQWPHVHVYVPSFPAPKFPGLHGLSGWAGLGWAWPGLGGKRKKEKNPQISSTIPSLA
jgi:hypothetical protein